MAKRPKQDSIHLFGVPLRLSFFGLRKLWQEVEERWWRPALEVCLQLFLRLRGYMLENTVSYIERFLQEFFPGWDSLELKDEDEDEV